MTIMLEVLPGAGDGRFPFMCTWDEYVGCFSVVVATTCCYGEDHRYFVRGCVTCGLSLKSMG